MEQQKDLFKHGPLHESRFEIVQSISDQIKTGDIFFRLGSEKFLLFSFSKLVAKLTNSFWSHASIAVVKESGVWLIEVNDRGTLEYRLIDWIDLCSSGSFAVYRVKNLSEEQTLAIKQECDSFLKSDPDYDFTFNHPDKFYCTESVVEIYKRCNIEIVKPSLIKELVNPFSYRIMAAINWVVSKFYDKSLPLDVPVYVVGNEQKGMLSSDKLEYIIKKSWKQ